mgnify:CR=1 FL=1
MIYEATIQFIAIDNNGNDKSTKQSYIIENAELFAQVENRLYEEFEGYTDLDVVAIKRSKIKEIANERTSDDEKIFLATLVDVFLNDDGSEKEIKYTIAFYSKDMNTAHAYIREYVSQGYNMGVKQIKESKLIDVLK